MVCWLQVIQQELVQIQRKCREQDMSERRLFEKMLGADKQTLASTAVHKATSASVISRALTTDPENMEKSRNSGAGNI